jgi:hypothetical protein
MPTFSQWRRNRRRTAFDSPRFAAPPPIQLASSFSPAPRPDLTNFFSAAWCISLDSDTARWRDFQSQLVACDWPFCPVTRFAAIEGDVVGIPDHFHQGGGAWGCLQSHRRILELSLMAGHQKFLVMEDDADLRPGFGAAVRDFLANLGEEKWDCLMLGGQHMATPIPLKPGVVRAAGPNGIQRTHCMAFTRDFARQLYRHWSAPIDQHCDWALGPFAARHRTLAPDRFLVGQRGGMSRIAWRQKPPEWWNPPPDDAPVVWLKCPRAVLEATRDIFHAGYRRNSAGVCVGLADVFDPKKNPTDRDQIAALRSWISMIQWEVASRHGAGGLALHGGQVGGDGSVCTIWNPAAHDQIISNAVDNVVIIDASTEAQARTSHRQLRLANQN